MHHIFTFSFNGSMMFASLSGFQMKLNWLVQDEFRRVCCPRLAG